MLLVQQGLEMLDVASERTSRNQEELRNRIKASSKELREIKGNAEAQAFTARENASLIQKLFCMVSGEVAAPITSLTRMVAKVYVSTQQIYTIVLELKASVLSIDTSFTFFQAPVRVEDALGRVFAFPSECSIEALNAEIEARFKEGPGKTEVLAGNFEIFNAKNADQVITISGRSVLVPRMSINMAIVLEGVFVDKCPMPHRASRRFVEVIGGGRTCLECDVWFDKTSKKRELDSEGKQSSKRVKTLADRNRNEARTWKTGERIAHIENSDSDETSIDAFKRIRFDNWASIPCLWGRMTGCKEVFLNSEFEEWVAHTEWVHLSIHSSKEGRRGARSYIGPPASNNCGFCDARFEADSGDLSWSNMMAHDHMHHMFGHYHTRIDWPLVGYLWGMVFSPTHNTGN